MALPTEVVTRAAHKKFEARFALVAVIHIHGAQTWCFCPVLDSWRRSMRGGRPRVERRIRLGEAAGGVAHPSLRGPNPERCGSRVGEKACPAMATCPGPKAPTVPAQGRADARQVVPAVPKCVVLQDELRGDWRAEAQGEECRPVHLVIRERANCGGCLSTFLAQEFERCGLRDPSVVAGMLSIHLGDNVPGDVP